MSVPKGKRGLSKLEFFHKAYILNDKITALLIRDFGVKKIARDLKAFTFSARMEADDQSQFISLCEKYGINTEAAYPLWMIDYYRDWILKILRNLVDNITQANTIYPTTEKEFYFRREFQWKAIGNCYQLLQAMQTVTRTLPVNLEKYMPYVDLIEEELALLKNWKKSDNKILKAIQAKEE